MDRSPSRNPSGFPFPMGLSSAAEYARLATALVRADVPTQISPVYAVRELGPPLVQRRTLARVREGKAACDREDECSYVLDGELDRLRRRPRRLL